MIDRYYDWLYGLGWRLGLRLGHLLAVLLWTIKPLRPRLARWALGKDR